MVLTREIEQQVVSPVSSFSSKIILTLFSSKSHIQREEKFETWNVGLYKYMAYYLNASVSEKLRNKWHVYNYPSTINKLQIAVCSQRQRKIKKYFY